MRFADVQHQEAALSRLREALARGSVAHAYLFAGPAGVGKEMAALRLAARLLCSSSKPDPGGDPCGRCEDCALMTAGTHPDYHRIHRGLGKLHPDREVQKRKHLELSIDVVRHFVIGPATKTPARGRAKVFVLVEADRLNAAAQNALLKTLEEPPGCGYLILLTSTAEVLLPTVRSRCQTVAFRHLPRTFLVDQVRQCGGVDETGAGFLAEMSQGSLGQALRLVELNVLAQLPVALKAIGKARTEPLASAKELKEISDALAKATKSASGQATEEDDEESISTDHARQGHAILLTMLSTILRDVQRRQVGLEAQALADEPTVAEWASRWPASAASRAIRGVRAIEQAIESNAYVPLAFDVLGLALGGADAAKSLAR